MLGTKKEVSFKNLTFDQYILGKSQILNQPKISEIERNTRVYLMKHISKLNEKIAFNKSKEFYQETLLSIEKGEFTWGNTYNSKKIENKIRFENMKVDHSPALKISFSSDVKCCKDYNSNKCTLNSNHQGRLN